jgi:cysteine synthase A
MCINKSIVEAMEQPKLIRLSENYYAICFSLMKLLPARYIVEMAEKLKILKKDSVIIETSSGTFGLGLALVGHKFGYKVIIVGDPAIDQNLKNRMESLGTKVVIVDKPSANGGIQKARLEKMNELMTIHPNHFWPSQYDNIFNPDSYKVIADLLLSELGNIDILCGPVGSGGSMCGTMRALRKTNENVMAVGIDTHNSVLFGQKDGKRLLRGLGNSLFPKNLDHTVFDDVHWVSAKDAFTATRLLHEQHALFMGGTSGAAYLVSKHYASINPDKKVAVIFPDEGYRYQTTIYNKQWLVDNEVFGDSIPKEPTLVSCPENTGTNWSYMNWNRRSYECVINSIKI